MNNEWISVKNRLPEIIMDGEECNCVLVYQKDGFDGGSDIQVWNTIYLHNHNHHFTYWMPLPDPPEDEHKAKRKE